MEHVKLVHAISGFAVAALGLAQILMKKGGRLHRVLGVAYLLLWFVVVGTGAFLGALLITLFGVLGLYMAYTGARFGHLKSSSLWTVDKVVIAAGALVAAATLVWGVRLLLRGHTTFGTIAGFFGLIFLLTTAQDLHEFILGQPIRRLSGHKMQWFFEHFSRMVISYIAAMTAFTAIQRPTPYPIVNWIGPSLIGTALIIWSNRSYEASMGIEPVAREPEAS